MINVRQTLISMPLGEENALVLGFDEVRGSTLRCIAVHLKELGYQFHVNKTEYGYKVVRVK